jgi:hypothetical protein
MLAQFAQSNVCHAITVAHVLHVLQRVGTTDSFGHCDCRSPTSVPTAPSPRWASPTGRAGRRSTTSSATNCSDPRAFLHIGFPARLVCRTTGRVSCRRDRCHDHHRRGVRDRRGGVYPPPQSDVDPDHSDTRRGRGRRVPGDRRAPGRSRGDLRRDTCLGQRPHPPEAENHRLSQDWSSRRRSLAGVVFGPGGCGVRRVVHRGWARRGLVVGASRRIGADDLGHHHGDLIGLARLRR